MSISLANSARILGRTLLLFAIAFLLVVSPTVADECDMGAASRNDFLVGLYPGPWGLIRSGTIGITECGTFIVAFTSEAESEVEYTVCGQPRTAAAVTGVYAMRFEASGSQIDLEPFILTDASDEFHSMEPTQFYFHPSLAVSRDGEVVVVFTGRADNGRTLDDCECEGGSCPCEYPAVGTHLIHTVFAFDSAPGLVAVPGIAYDWRDNADPSAGISGSGSPMHAWANNNVPLPIICEYEEPCPPYVITGTPGWLFGPHHDDPHAFLACGSCESSPDVRCSFPFDPEPCISVRSDGIFAIAWADPEEPSFADSHANIKVRIYDPSSGFPTIDETIVNDPNHEPEGSDQLSPAVALDDFGNVVVCWVGVRESACDASHTLPDFPIYARRFKFSTGGGLRDPNPAMGEGLAGQFIVDNLGTHFGGPVNQQDANPTVALTLNQQNAGRFFVAWNNNHPSIINREVHGQYFNSQGRPMGRQFVAHQNTQPFSGIDYAFRMLADSAQHTCVYGDQDQVVLAYTQQHTEGGSNPLDEVWAAFHPPGYWEYLDGLQSCCKGDLNVEGEGDGLVNGDDIQPFIDLILDPPLLGDTPCKGFAQFYYEALCKADMNDDAVLTVGDIPPFIERLMAGTECEGSFTPRGMTDCNANGVDDANDIGWGNSHDCNVNGIPDECDIDPADPDGNELVSDDENEDGVPDECQPDCNANGHPDDLDIAGASNDVNSNDIPDECEPDCNDNDVPDDWDISESTSADCNLNGVPDECELAIRDCNSNGVPDDCDVDPLDPDGDEWVSADCNGNKYPDECDLTLTPPFGSLDCNENGIPDECDIAGQTSLDENENGIPDECEQEQQMMMGGGEGGGQALSEAERWTAFFDWCTSADFSGMTQREKYDSIMAELGALDLPRAWPPVVMAQ
jgi:hypothetical protein